MKQRLFIPVFILFISPYVSAGDFTKKAIDDFVSKKISLPGYGYQTSLTDTIDRFKQKIAAEQRPERRLRYGIGLAKLILTHNLRHENHRELIECVYWHLQKRITEVNTINLHRISNVKKYHKHIEYAKIYLGRLIAEKIPKANGVMLENAYNILQSYQLNGRLNKVLMAQLIIDKKLCPKNAVGQRMSRHEAKAIARQLLEDSFSTSSDRATMSEPSRKHAVSEKDALISITDLRSKKFQKLRDRLIAKSNPVVQETQKPKRKVKRIPSSDSEEQDLVSIASSSLLGTASVNAQPSVEQKSNETKKRKRASSLEPEREDNSASGGMLSQQEQEPVEQDEPMEIDDSFTRSLSEEDQKEIRKLYLRKEGRLTYDQIAQKMGCTLYQVDGVIRKAGIANRKKRKTK